MACGQPAGLKVENVWTRDTIGSSANAAVYMTITAPAADRLIAASSPVANRTDLMTMEGGASATGMAYVEAIDLPANTAVSLAPSGLHVWLADLKQPLTAGQTFPLVLEFENAGQREVIVSVIAPNAMAPMSGM
ncbi:MAG: copper chaperone PCu(A)C [Terricaulis sp.]